MSNPRKRKTPDRVAAHFPRPKTRHVQNAPDAVLVSTAGIREAWRNIQRVQISTRSDDDQRYLYRVFAWLRDLNNSLEPRTVSARRKRVG